MVDRSSLRTRARRALLCYLRREPDRLVQVGHVANWLCGGCSLQRTEDFLESLVTEGILRHATPEELRAASLRHGYFVTEHGLEMLPPEDRSYGII